MELGSILVTTILLLATGDAYNILIIYPTPSISHQVPVMALTETLVKRGHHVFVVSPNIVPGLERNYTFVNMSFVYEIFERASKCDGNDEVQASKWDTLLQFFSVMARIVNIQFKCQEFLTFVERVKDENIQFDVVLVESFVMPHGCAMSRLLHGFNRLSSTGSPTPPPVLISFVTLASNRYAEYDLGSIDHRSFSPSLFKAYTDRMSLWQKMDNWFASTYIKYEVKNIMEQAARNFFRETYGDESLVDGCWANVSLSMTSSNFVYSYPRALGPNVIELGPLHLGKKPEQLPQKIQNWLDGAEKGVIYFSLGSNMESKSLPVSMRENFLKFFRELPPGYRVLWKWELDRKIPGQSDNILGQKWIQQQSVLAHPKVKVFITQGGLQSFQETVHYGVPTVGIPWYGDQENNVAKMVDAGIGVRIRPKELYSFENIKSALETVLYDESYARNMKKLSAISREFTSQSHDKAVFWIEHVAKFGGAPHLRPSTADATLFEYFCLDIITVILVFILTVLYVTKLVFRFMFARISSFSSSKTKVS